VDDNQPVLVLIGLDPRASHRANEAMRIGLGVVSGENEVTFCSEARASTCSTPTPTS